MFLLSIEIKMQKSILMLKKFGGDVWGTRLGSDVTNKTRPPKRSIQRRLGAL
jgi:hypothetical protein